MAYIYEAARPPPGGEFIPTAVPPHSSFRGFILFMTFISEEFNLPIIKKKKEKQLKIIESEIEDLGFILHIPVEAQNITDLEDEDCFLLIEEKLKEKNIKIFSFNVSNKNYFPVDDAGNIVNIKSLSDKNKIKKWRLIVTVFVD